MLGTLSYGAVLGLPGTELTFPTAAPRVLCSALGARTPLPSHQCLGNYGAVLAQHQDTFSNPFKARKWRVGKRREETSPGQLT